VRLLRPAALLVLVGGALVLAGRSQAPPASAAGSFYCALNATCPEVTIAGDPFATLGGNPAPFRGYGDPSLERDPDTGDIWLSYSWLDVLISSPGPPPVTDLGVRTHLAKSTNGGQTFSFVRAVNSTLPITHPDTTAQGWTIHEVSTLAREGPGQWQMQWLTYFDPFGPPERSDFYYTQSVASSPAALGNASTPWIRTNSTLPSWGVVHNLSAIPQLSDCTALSEPALLSNGGATYLASNCVVFQNNARQDAQERLVLLRQEANGYSYVGELLDYSDAVFLGGSRLEQADLSVAQNGAILLIVTPIQNGTPEHFGCDVLEIADITKASVRRDLAGNPEKLYEITGEDPILGPGLCTYDAASATGVMMVLHKYTPSPFDMEFSLRATRVHPLGLDSDGDGLADSADPDDDNDGFADSVESGASLCGDGRNEDGLIFDGSDDDVVDDGCPGGPPQSGAYSEAGFSIGTGPLDPCGTNAWPLDLASGGVPDSTNRVTITDLTSFLAPIRRLDSSPGRPSFSSRWDLVPGHGLFTNWIVINDLTSLLAGPTGSPPMLGGARAFNGPVCPVLP